jgi:hypothetical protein
MLQEKSLHTLVDALLKQKHENQTIFGPEKDFVPGFVLFSCLCFQSVYFSVTLKETDTGLRNANHIGSRD